MATAATTQTFVAALAAAEQGDLRELPGWEEALAKDHSADARARGFGCAAVRWLLDPRYSPAPRPEELATLTGLTAQAQTVAARACGRMVRAAVLGFDGAALRRWSDVLAGLPLASAGSPWPALARAWIALSSGKATLSASLEADMATALQSGDPAATVEATVLRALFEADQGDAAAALETARRAARMAQSEARPEEEFFAHLVLARLRRRGGRPHLAVHILTDLSRHAPSPWIPWIAWELVMAGAATQAQALIATSSLQSEPPALKAAQAALRLLSAVHAGDRAATDEASGDLTEIPLWSGLQEEIATVLLLIDPDRGATGHPWIHGDEHTVPLGLGSLGLPPGPAGTLDETVALVAAKPGATGRRLLRGGSRLVSGATNLEGAIDDTGGARTETGLAVLALAGTVPLAREALFRAIYGFPFVHDRHRGVLDVLIHRMRTRLGDAGTIERDSKTSTVALVLNSPIFVPDGRCTLAPAERVLRALADLGTTGTQQAADRLNVPLRNVQRTLQELVAEGSCQAVREGSNVVYRIRDTTFTSVHTLDISKLR